MRLLKAVSFTPVHQQKSSWRFRTVLNVRVGGAALICSAILLAAALVPSGCYADLAGLLAWLGWIVGVMLIVLAAAEAFEIVELAMRNERESEEHPCADVHPFVSLHVPIHAEPPEVVARTLQALCALDYGNFEVLVIDNNTADENLWRPVEQLCKELGPRFRFFHLPRWSGYKAGALNFALAQTSPEASIVGVVDADYEVRRDFLQSLTPYFSDERVGFVQAPQNYQQWEGRWFSRMCYWEYWQFFAVSMRLRNSRNAILMHGTMVMIRKAAFLRVGGWAEWCLTEDSELGLRLLAAGYRGVYRSETYGRGLVPFTYESYRRQRQRWVTGGVQIVRRHWMLFLPWARSLTAAQKMHYLQGWAPWLRDGIIVGCMPLVFFLAAYCLSVSGSPEPARPLMLAIFGVGSYLAIRQIVVYRPYLKRPWADGAGAGLVIFGLIMTVGCAWLRGWTGLRIPFHRTPKEARPRGATQLSTSRELVVGMTAIMFGLGMLIRFGISGAGVAAGLTAYAILFLSSTYVQFVDRQWD